MSPEQWKKIKEIFHSALECEAGQRAALLDDACGGDDTLRKEVESLIRAHEEEPDFIEQSAVRAAGLPDGGGADPLVNKRIGPYRIERPIASGGMGVVYLAARDDDAYRKHVAIKLLRADRFFDIPLRREEVMRRFRVERQALADLDHPNIARLHDGGTTEEGLPYLVMDYIEGLPIDEYCDEHCLSTVDRLELFRSVCGAVHYAHQRLVVHRDLKPSNILVDKDGTPKLLDFGIAKLLDGDPMRPAQHTHTALQPMTPEYASPEQARGSRITTASDVYSLGVILYELLTGHRPYRIERAPRHELARVICEQQPFRPSTIVMSVGERMTRDGVTAVTLTPQSVSETRDGAPDRLRRQLSGDMDMIMLKALRKEPERRYASADEFSEDIRRHLAGEAIIARPPSLVYTLRIFTRRHKPLVGAVATVFAVLVAGVIISTSLYLQAELRKAESEAVTKFLSDTLASVDPAEALGREVTIREVLERASAKIEASLSDQPLVEATLRTTIGNTYRALGNTDQAEAHLTSSLAIRSKALGDEHPDTLLSKNDLANVYADQGRFPEAETLYRSALAVQQRVVGKEHPDTLGTMSNLAAALQRQRKLGEARTLHKAALAARRRVLGSAHKDTMQSMNSLANVLAERGKPAEARVLYEEALKGQHRAFGDDHPDTLQSMSNLAIVLFQQGELAEAEALHRRTLAAQRRVLGSDHPRTLSTMSSLAVVLTVQGKLAAAERNHRTTLETRRLVLGEEHPDTLQSMNNLANALGDLGRFAEAEALHRRTLDHRRRALGEEHPDTLLSMNNLANVLGEQGRNAEAGELHLRTLALQRRVLGESHPDTLASMNNVAHFLMHTDPRGALSLAEGVVRSGGGEPYSLDTLATAYRANGDLSQAIKTQRRAAALLPAGESRLKSAIETRLVSLLREHGDEGAATEILDKGFAETERMHGKPRAELVRLMTDLALQLLVQDQLRLHEALCDELAEVRQSAAPRNELRSIGRIIGYANGLLAEENAGGAEALMRKTVAVCEAGLPAGHLITARAVGALGVSLLQQRRFQDAEPLLLNSHERLTNSASADSDDKRVVLDGLVRLYEDWGQADRAAEYRALRSALGD